MAKRDATSELNHTNWDKEDEPEEPGTFPMASQEELQRRVIKKAKRRPDYQEGSAESGVFSGFKGFKIPESQPTTDFNWIIPQTSMNGSVSQSIDFPMFSTANNAIPTSVSTTTSSSATTTASTTSSASTTIQATTSTSVPTTTSVSQPFNFNLGSLFSNTTASDSKKVSATTLPSICTSPTNAMVSVASSLSSKLSSMLPSGFNIPYITSTNTPTSVTTLQNTSATSNTKTNTSTSGSETRTTDRQKEYYSKLKALNEDVCAWICKHVKENPYCILTPIFADYEKYYREFDKAYPPGSAIKSSNPVSISPLAKLNSVLNPVPAAVTDLISRMTPTITSSPVTRQQCLTNVDNINNDKETGTLMTNVVTNSSPFSLAENSVVTTNLPITTLPQPSFDPSSDTTSTMKSFSFAVTPSVPATDTNYDDENYEPPIPDVQTVVEEGSVYSKRCKLFFKKDETFVERGIGVLYLKPSDEKKTQLIIRADTNLGNILLNIILNESIKTQITGKNNVLLVCVPNPPIDSKPELKQKPVPMLIRVKSQAEAEELLETLNKLKS